MTSDGSLTVGVDAWGYRERRNIYGLPFEDVRFRRVRGARAPLNWLNYRLGRGENYSLQHKFQDFGLSPVDLHHFFFSLSFGRRPWFVSFSSWLPRWGKRDRRGLELLAGGPCRGLIAISDHAWQVQKHVMSYAEDLIPELERKLTVLHPSQRLLIETYDEKPLHDDVVDFVFVGRQFFRKGGDAVLRVFSRILDENAPARLHIVSSLEHRDHASRATAADAEWARALIARYPGRIVLHERLANDDVLALLRRSHVALLPTIAEAYGYVVLEAQAAGCPVITTAVQALPEVNDTEVGWSLPVPLNEMGRALRRSDADRAAFARALEESLEHAVREAVGDPALIRRKGIRALERIARDHRPEAAAATLTGLYRNALEA